MLHKKKKYFLPHGEQSLLVLEIKLGKYGNYRCSLSDAERINTVHCVGKIQVFLKHEVKEMSSRSRDIRNTNLFLFFGKNVASCPGVENRRVFVFN
jgi:hypothetical protein